MSAHCLNYTPEPASRAPRHLGLVASFLGIWVWIVRPRLQKALDRVFELGAGRG